MTFFACASVNRGFSRRSELLHPLRGY